MREDFGIARGDGMLKAKTALFPPDQLMALAKLAKARKIGEDALLREALEDLLKKYNHLNARGRRVMIVEDSAMMRMLLEDSLKRDGYEIVGKAENGLEAVRLFNNTAEGFDYVFLNVTMPKMDGIEALEDFKREHNSRIIMITSTRNAGLVLDSISNGAHHILYRPFEREDLTEVMTGKGFLKENLNSYKKYLNDMNLPLEYDLSQKDIYKMINAAEA